MFGSNPATAVAVSGTSAPPGALAGPPNEYENVGSSPLPCTQILNAVVPEAGRVTVNGAAPMSQLFGLESAPMKSTLMGAPDAEVVASVTANCIDHNVGCAEVSESALAVVENGAITNGTGFDSAPLGFWIWTVNVPATATSVAVSAVAQTLVEPHVVIREAPLTSIVEPVPLAPAAKFRPCTSSGNPSTAPAATLDGSNTSIVAPVSIATVAAIETAGTPLVVAITEIAFGDGALDGAVNTPLALTVPQAAPLHPAPETADATDQVTATGVPSEASAKNCWVLGAPPVAATKAYSGSTETPLLGVPAWISISAVALRLGSAWPVATTSTGFCAGADAGARYITLPAAAPPGATQGLASDWQICPTNGLPFAMPFTNHVTLASVEPLTDGVSMIDCDGAREAEDGLRVTETSLTSATSAAALAPPAVAWTTIDAPAGSCGGAVYLAAFAPADEIVPTVKLPPTIPFTSHTTLEPAAAQIDAVNACVSPSDTVTLDGEIVFADEQEIVTIALADFEGSAAIAAVTVTGFCAGNAAGAVYTAASGPAGATVPVAGLPPATPSTLHTSCCDPPAPPEIAAVNTCAPLGGTVADVGVRVTSTTDDCSVTTADAVEVGSATLKAVTVTLAEVAVPGAVKSPVAEIVPVVADPPAVPFTSHVTPVFDVPETCALNCCVWLAARFAPEGLIFTTTGLSLGGVPAYPHPINVAALATNASKPSPAQCKNLERHDERDAFARAASIVCNLILRSIPNRIARGVPPRSRQGRPSFENLGDPCGEIKSFLSRQLRGMAGDSEIGDLCLSAPTTVSIQNQIAAENPNWNCGEGGAFVDSPAPTPNNAAVDKPEIVRRIKTYSAANGYVYQYQFHEVRPARREGQTGVEYIYYVTADRKTMFPVRIFVVRDAIQKWSHASLRSLNGTEEYAVAKMRLFEGFDEVPDFHTARPDLIVDDTNIGELLEKLNL
jgi:hypothetical protein